MKKCIAALILAAGKGTRMKSALPKVLHPLLGKPLVLFPVELAQGAGLDPVVVVVGHGADAVRAVLPSSVKVAIQVEQRGTGDAVRAGLAALEGFEGEVVILSGDVPRLTRATLDRLLAVEGPAMLSAQAPSPRGYGRVVRSRDGRVARIVEEKDATAAERAIREINAGIYRFDAAFLRAQLATLTTHNAQGELYLTDLVQVAPGLSCLPADLGEVAGINDRVELAQAGQAVQREVLSAHQRAGVTIPRPETVTVELGVTLAADVTLEEGCVLRGKTRVGAGTVIRAHSVLESAEVGPECLVGPFARLRPGTKLGPRVHVGNFVETKNAELAEGAKANHLSYLGDARIGRATNIGAGTITCNYDGVQKHLTEIGAGVFVGSDTQLVAPVKVGDGAYIASGTTVTEDVPADSLVLTRAPTVVKNGWAKRKRAGSGPR